MPGHPLRCAAREGLWIVNLISSEALSIDNNCVCWLSLHRDPMTKARFSLMDI